MRVFLIVLSIFFEFILFSQNDKKCYLSRDSIEIEFNSPYSNYDVFYKNISTKTPYSGWLIWQLKDEIKVFQVKNGVHHGYYFLYKKKKKGYVLNKYEIYHYGSCWETVSCKNKKGNRVVKNVSLYLYKEHAIYHEIYDDNILWIDIKYKKKYYQIKKVYKNGDKNKIQKIRYNTVELEPKLVASIINAFDKIPFPFIINSIDDLPCPIEFSIQK